MLTRKDDHVDNKEKSSHQKSAGLPQKSGNHRGNKTRVTVHYDVGFRNSLFIRGKGANLSWEHGIPLKNIAADCWVWEIDDMFTVAEFKILINDTMYEDGSNHTIKCGAHIEYTPHFADHYVG